MMIIHEAIIKSKSNLHAVCNVTGEVVHGKERG